MALKARCVFVPLETALPDKRLAALIAEVRPAGSVADAGGLERLRPLLSREPETPVILSNPEEAEPPAACCSGRSRTTASTCSSPRARPAPKGIVGRLKGIDHFIRWEIETFEIPEGARVASSPAPAFDSFLRDVFVPLSPGGAIARPRAARRILDSRRLAAGSTRRGSS